MKVRKSPPRCRYCKSENVKISGTPPGACSLACKACKKTYPVCGAKRNGGRCCTAPMPNGRCRLDGGVSPGAPIITGKYSKHLKGSLLEAFERSRTDSNLLSIREDIAMFEAAQIQRLPRMMDADSQAELWKAAGQHFDDLTAAIASKDKDQTKVSLHLLGNVLNNGVGAVKAEEEFFEYGERKARLQQYEIKKLTMLQDYADSRAVVARMAQFYEAVVDNVKDPDVIKRIAAQLDRSSNPRPL